MRNTVDILGVKIDKLTFNEALDIAENLVQSEGVSAIFTPNPEIIMCARQDDELRAILSGADLCTADGIGVVYGAKILNNPVPERVAGFDLTCNLLNYMKDTEDSVFLFGAKPGVAKIAKQKLMEMYPGLKVAGTNDGYFTENDIPVIIICKHRYSKLLIGNPIW